MCSERREPVTNRAAAFCTDCSQCRTPRRGWSLVLGVLSTSRRSCARCTLVTRPPASHVQAGNACPQVLERPGPDVPGWLLSTDWRPSLWNEISGDLDTPRAARARSTYDASTTDHRRAKHLEQLASCDTRSVTVQSRFQETAKDSSVWMTIAALVRLNWRLRNVLTYLLT